MAASKNKATRKNTAATLEPTARHLWLASLGMLFATRRESKAALKRVAAKADSAATDARKAIKRARSDLRGSIDGVRSQVQPKVVKFSSDVEARLAPVLDKLGLTQKAKRAPRKTRTTATKPTRRTVRKPAKRAAKKLAV